MRSNTKRVYKFDKYGELIKSYDSASDAASENKMARSMIYFYHQNNTLVRKEFYLSFDLKITPVTFHARKSTDPVEHSIDTLETVKSYREELAIYLELHFDNLTEVKRLKFLNEFNNTTKYLNYAFK